jgi:hypothetical protein
MTALADPVNVTKLIGLRTGDRLLQLLQDPLPSANDRPSVSALSPKAGRENVATSTSVASPQSVTAALPQ